MKVYKLEMLGSSCTYKSVEDLLEEVRLSLEEGGDDEVVILPLEMTEEEYDRLPEFQGW